MFAQLSMITAAVDSSLTGSQYVYVDDNMILIEWCSFYVLGFDDNHFQAHSSNSVPKTIIYMPVWLLMWEKTL